MASAPSMAAMNAVSRLKIPPARITRQFWNRDGCAPFEIQHHLSKGERAMLPHVAAGLISLADHVPDARFQGEPQQGLIRGDIHDLYAAFQQFS